MKMLLLTATLLTAVPAAAQESPMPMPTPEEMQAMMALMGPGPEHADLASLEGTWSGVMKFSSGPGQTMDVTTSTVNTMVLGGRFLKSESKGEMPGVGVIETLTMYGFDRRTGEYTLVGFDTMGTYYVTAAGSRAQGARDVVMKGETKEGGKTLSYDMVLRWVDADTYVSEIIFHMPQGDMKIAEMTFTRVK